MQRAVSSLAVVFAIASGPLQRVAAADAVGSLAIESEPTGASVYVDGRLAGQTPLTLSTIAAGVHRVRLLRLGYLENSRLVTVKAGSRATLWARLTSPRPQTAGQAALRIVVVEGEGAVNIIQQKTAVAPVVEVRDRNDQPVAGAVVRFAIRSGRATFSGARTISVTTDAGGRAIAAGFAPTGTGGLQIGATAAFQGQTAAITIAQTTVTTAAQAASASAAAAGSSGGGGGLSGATIAGIAGGVGAGALVAARIVRKDDSPIASAFENRPTYEFTFSANLSAIAQCPLYNGPQGAGVGPFAFGGDVNPDGSFSFTFSLLTPAAQAAGRFTATDVNATIACLGGGGPTGSLTATGKPSEYQGTWNWGNQSGTVVVRPR
jgi:hypothetical protein